MVVIERPKLEKRLEKRIATALQVSLPHSSRINPAADIRTFVPLLAFNSRDQLEAATYLVHHLPELLALRGHLLTDGKGLELFTLKGFYEAMIRPGAAQYQSIDLLAALNVEREKCYVHEDVEDIPPFLRIDPNLAVTYGTKDVVSHGGESVDPKSDSDYELSEQLEPSD